MLHILQQMILILDKEKIMINPQSKQEAQALLAKRSDTLRVLKADAKEVEQEIDMLIAYIKKCDDKSQLDMFGG